MSRTKIKIMNLLSVPNPGSHVGFCSFSKGNVLKIFDWMPQMLQPEIGQKGAWVFSLMYLEHEKASLGSPLLIHRLELRRIQTSVLQYFQHQLDSTCECHWLVEMIICAFLYQKLNLDSVLDWTQPVERQVLPFFFIWKWKNLSSWFLFL